MKTQTEGNVLKVLGLDRLSATNSAGFRDLVKGEIRDQHRVVEVDSTGISFFDSEGLGALVSVQRAMAAQQGRVRLVHPQPIVRQFLTLMHFHRVLDIVP